jgi:leucyl aminopeptidase (aminopeptidase T)
MVLENILDLVSPPCYHKRQQNQAVKSITMIEIAKACKTAIHKCLGVKNDESLLVIGDEPSRNIAYAFFNAGAQSAAECILIEIVPRGMHGEELPAAVGHIMKQVNCVIAPTSKSISHTRARMDACLSGTRIATLPGVTEDILMRGMLADYDKIAIRTQKLAKILSKAKIARIEKENGTLVTFELGNRGARADTGIIQKPGSFSNLPAGEAYIAPLEEKTNGTIVFDGSFAGIGTLSEPIRVKIQAGYVSNIVGGKDAMQLKAILEKAGKPGRNVAELGMGTNEKAEISGNILEDEKVMGTLHVAFGDNSTIGGLIEASIHLDGIIKSPTLFIDDVKIMERGRLLTLS